jgi:hypothetical protein
LDTSHALRQTSDALMRDLDVLAALEEEKRGLAPGDPRLVELAGRIEDIAERILSGSIRQHQLTESANAQVESGADTAPTKPIEATSRPIGAILADWREAERRSMDAVPGSAEASESRALVDALRDEYRRAYDSARRAR